MQIYDTGLDDLLKLHLNRHEETVPDKMLQYTEAISIKGTNIAIDLGLDKKVFREVWDKSEKGRTRGIDSLTNVNYNLINNC